MTDGTLKIATANRLADGAAVYFTASGDWSEFIDDGLVVADHAAAERLMKTAGLSVRRQVVINPYLIDMVADGAAVRPRRVRETIRAGGPSIADLAGREAERRHQHVRV
jgi:Protein of unknown function (DUF2849)